MGLKKIARRFEDCIAYLSDQEDQEDFECVLEDLYAYIAKKAERKQKLIDHTLDQMAEDHCNI